MSTRLGQLIVGVGSYVSDGAEPGRIDHCDGGTAAVGSNRNGGEAVDGVFGVLPHHFQRSRVVHLDGGTLFGRHHQAARLGGERGVGLSAKAVFDHADEPVLLAGSPQCVHHLDGLVVAGRGVDRFDGEQRRQLRVLFQDVDRRRGQLTGLGERFG